MKLDRLERAAAGIVLIVWAAWFVLAVVSALLALSPSFNNPIPVLLLGAILALATGAVACLLGVRRFFSKP